jgi:hypothetical protein
MAIEIKYSVYPSAIDSGTQLPVVCDNITEVNAESMNRLRSAIIAVEGELGIDPSGVYTTVRARLDALEQLIANLGGGDSGITTVLDEGILIDNSASSINFVGDIVTATSDGSGNITVQVDGYAGAAVQKQETIPVTSFSQASFTLTEIPADSTAVEMFVNGIKQQYGTDYVVSETIVTYLDTATYPLNPPDIVEFWYLVSGFISGGGGGTDLIVQEAGVTVDPQTALINFASGATVTSGGVGIVNVDISGGSGGGDQVIQEQETVPVIINGQSSFNLSQQPLENDAVQMVVNGIKQQYGVDYTVSSGIANYTGTPALITADAVEFWYIVDGYVGPGSDNQTWGETLGLGNTSDGYDVILNSPSKITTTDTNNNDVFSLEIQPGDVLSGNGNGGNVIINSTAGLGSGLDGYVIINGLSWPFQDGSAGQSIVTDGAGNLSFDTQSGSSTSLQEAYEAGPTIATTAVVGSLSVSGTEAVSLTSIAGDITAQTGGQVTIAGNTSLRLNGGAAGIDIWPNAQVAGALVNDGSGALTWEALTTSTGPVNNIQTSDGAGGFLANDWSAAGDLLSYTGAGGGNIAASAGQDILVSTAAGNVGLLSTVGNASVIGSGGVSVQSALGSVVLSGAVGLSLNAGGGADNWPVVQGTGALVNDGSGTLTWEPVSDELEISAEVTTLNDTPVTIISNTPADGTVTNIVVKFAAYDGTAQEGGVFISQGAFITNSGSTTQIGTTAITHIERQDSTWVVDFSTSGADILVTVQGDAINATNWKAVAKIVQVI